LIGTLPWSEKTLHVQDRISNQEHTLILFGKQAYVVGWKFCLERASSFRFICKKKRIVLLFTVLF
jgi:hypothetical protein